ncbi:MAG: chemotaxis protein CheA, partial [Opitutus sp.]|nr:chemotaxis protein CheA [Opitutus sp.]
MPLAPESFQSLDDSLSRLAAESIFAQPGRDDGLIPSYSLLGEMKERSAGEPAITAAVAFVHGTLDKLLDAAQPFDGDALAKLRSLIDWLPKALDAVRAGKAPAPFAGAAESAAAAPGGAPAPAETEHASDVLLELNLGENQELLTEFHAEAVDHLQQIEAALLILDQTPDNPEALNSIFRSFHTIKGNAGFLGLVPMHTLAHEVESLLDLARNRELRLTPAIITEILRSRDALQLLTQQIAVALEKGQLPGSIIPVSHLIRAVKHLASGRPAPAEAPATAPEAAPAAPAPASDAPVSAVVATPSAPPASTAAANAIEAQAASKPASGGQTVRVNTEKLDSLMDVVGELVIVQSQLIESARRLADDGSPIHRNVAQLSRIAKDLQHTAMSLRMIPIKPTFQKMERLARDLARNFGKKVHFQVSGEDTELDRTVVEEIADPLVHMVRNALDHGLEGPEQRAAAGKPEQGTVHLRAYHQGSNIVIELQDDGRGIDPERILRKAVEKGIVAANAALSREEIYALLFAP